MANYYEQRDEKAQGFYGADAGNDGWGASSDFSYPYVDPHQQPSQQFASFDYDTPQQAPNFYTPTVGSSYGGASASPAPSYFVPQTAPIDNKVGDSSSGFDNFDDEPPLLEELGINPYHILEKTLSVLNPLRNTDAIVLQDTDIVGPVVFCVLFGVILLFSGKIHFGYIYGIGVMGCIAMYFLLNMMSVAGVSLGVTVSVLGYCLLPMVGLAGINLILSLQGAVGTIFTALAVLWCSLSASKLFVTALGLQKQQPLVAYPCALLYGVFALLAVF